MGNPSTFDNVEAAFQALACDRTMVVDGSLIGRGCGAIPVTELRGVVLHPGTPSSVRDRAIRVVLFRARRLRGPWTVALAGLLLPGLRGAVASLERSCPNRADDVEADALAALLEVLDSFDAGPRGVGPRLIWLTAARARRRLARELAAEGVSVSAVSSVEPHRPWGHPDFVLAEAVRDGVISSRDAELIGQTRLGEVSLRTIAIEQNESEDRLWRVRRDAEQKLVRWLKKSRGIGTFSRLLQGAGRP